MEPTGTTRCRPTTSQQRASLCRGDIVTSRRIGQEVPYRGDRDNVTRVLGDLQDYRMRP